MGNPDTHDAARALNAARWGTRKLDSALAVVVERADQLSTVQRAVLLAAVGDDPAPGDGEGAA